MVVLLFIFAGIFYYPTKEKEEADTGYKIEIPSYTEEEIRGMSTEQKGSLIYQYLATASIYLQLKQFEQAQGFYETAFKLSSGTNRQAIDKLGEIYFRRKKYDLAEKMYRLANERGERDLAVLLYVQKRFDELKPLLEKISVTHAADPVIQEMARALKIKEDKEGRAPVIPLN